MANYTFDFDLNRPMEFTLYRKEDPELTFFGGFIKPEILHRARVSRESFKMCERWYKINKKEMPASVYLSFLAQAFAEIEAQDEPKPDNPCAEIPLEHRSFSNLRSMEPPPFKHEGDWDPSKYKK